MRNLFTAVMLSFSGCLFSPSILAQEHKTCSAYSELDCIHSTECKLELTGERSKYVCRESVGRCESGFRQAGDGDIREACESMPGCQFEPEAVIARLTWPVSAAAARRRSAPSAQSHIRAARAPRRWPWRPERASSADVSRRTSTTSKSSALSICRLP